MVIESINNENVKYLEKLKIKKYRDLYNEYIIEGYHLVEEAYKYHRLKKVFILEDDDIDVDVEKVLLSSKVFKKISVLENSNQVIGICSKEQNNEIIGNKLLLLDNIQDPGNLGTIIRSAAAFNIDTVIISKDSVDLYNSKVLRATGGLIYSMNIVIDDLQKVIKDLKQNDVNIYATDVKEGKEIKSLNKDKYAIIMGNEGNGVKQEIKNLCSDYINIKTSTKVESLNVAIATSLILYELDRK